jgi:hypothetical protein
MFLLSSPPCLRFIALLQAGLGFRLLRHIIEETSKGRVCFHMLAWTAHYCVEFYLLLIFFLMFYLDICVSAIFVSFLQVAIIDPTKKRTAKSGQGVPLGGIGYTFSQYTMCFRMNVECASVTGREHPS